MRQSVVKDWEKLCKENKKFLEIDIVESPSFITAYKEVASLNIKEIDANLSFKLYDTYGLDEEAISKISRVLDIKFNPDVLDQELERAKYRSKENSLIQDDNLYSILIKENIPKTDDSFKYLYKKNKNKYVFNNLDVKVLKIFHDGTSVSEVDSDFYCSLLIDKTNLYSEAGGQISDTGTISFGNDSFDVMSLENLNGYVLHKGFFKSNSSKLKVNATGQLSINENFRLGCMRNHTSTHLLNAVVKKLKGATSQKSSKVTDKYLSFDVAIFEDKLSVDQMDKIEKQILNTIRNMQPVNVSEVDSQKLLDYDSITLIPGEIYPDNNIRIIEIKDNEFVSR